MALIRTEHLSHVFPAPPQPIAALDDVTLSVTRGAYVAVVGANGSGKSTLARHFNALLLPTGGNIWVNDVNTRDRAQLRAIRENVAMVFQNPENQFVATVAEEDVAFGPENFGVPLSELRRRVAAALEEVGLTALRTRAPHELSAGQQQRLAVAGALALEPDALVLDEATSMLDPRGESVVMELAARLHGQGLTMVAITQSMEEAARAERVFVMGHGRVAQAGTPREVFADPERLRALDLDLPPFAAIAQQVHQRVPDFPAALLTLDELVEAIVSRAARLSPPASRLSPLAVSPHGSPIIETRALRHSYLSGTPRAVEALRGVEVEVFPGEIVGIVGTTGSGKSTLLQHFNGLLRPPPGEGTVVVNGVDLSNPHADVRAVRQQVGLVFQFAERQLFERYVGDDIAFGPRQFGYSREEVRRRVQWAMARVGLDFEGFKDRITRTLSGGEKRRAALAGVLALEPRVLVLDEPTAGLDPHGRRELLASLQQWRAESGVTIVLVSHRMDEIAQVCDRVYVLEAGRVALAGTPRELFSRGLDLTRFGLVPPPAVRLMQALRAGGVNVGADVLTVEDAVAEVSRVIVPSPNDLMPQ
jgi:energy-coupling factor transport system ATP-binding protein